MLDCGCKDLGYRENMTYEQLSELHSKVQTCTAGIYKGLGSTGWICPNVDQLLRKADLDRSRRNQYEKQRRRRGYTEPVKAKKRTLKMLQVVDVHDISV